MIRVLCCAILCIFISSQSFAATRIIAAEYMPLTGSLFVYSDTDGKYYISSVSLTECRESSRIAAVRASHAVISKYISPFVIAGLNTIDIFDTVGRRKEQTLGSFTRPVSVIAQSDDGSYVAASDSLSVELFAFQKDKLMPVYRKEFTGGVVGAYPDTDDKKLYVAESNGWISVWSFGGQLLQNINVPAKIKSILNDPQEGRLLALTGEGLVSLSKTGADNVTLLKGRINSVSLDSYSNRLILSSPAGTTAYDKYTMRAILMTKDAGKTVSSDGGNFIGVIVKNRIKIYDTKLNTQIGEIDFSDKGVTFLPVRFDARGTLVTSDFIAAVAGGKPAPIETNAAKICAPLAAMASGIYMPFSAEMADVRQPDIDGVASPRMSNVNDPFAVAEPRAPSVPIFNAGVSEPKISAAADPRTPAFKDTTKNPSVAESKDVQQPKSLEEMVSAKTPSWVANRKNLPKNNAVTNAASAEDAFKDAKTRLKGDLVKQILRIAVENTEVKNINDIELKKRLLWQSSANAAQSLDRSIHMAESWQTPAGQFFVLAVQSADNKTISGTADIFIKNELEKLNRLGEDAYMTARPIKID